MGKIFTKKLSVIASVGALAVSSFLFFLPLCSSNLVSKLNSKNSTTVAKDLVSTQRVDKNYEPSICNVRVKDD